MSTRIILEGVAGLFAGEARTLEAINAELGILDASDLRTSSEGRLGVATFFPDFSFRSPLMYRLRATDPGACSRTTCAVQCMSSTA